MTGPGRPGVDPLAPPARLYPLRYHEKQDKLQNGPHRFVVVPAGRRSGKTELAKRKIVRACIEACDKPWPDPRFFAGAPTRDQARAIYWSDLKSMFPRKLVNDISETHLMIQLITGAEAWVIGMDKPERVEGRPWDGCVLDEFANMKEKAWGENVRPALSDRGGWAWLIGVPEGRNHYYTLNRYALSGVDEDWASYTWPSSDILPAKEVEAARRQLDPLTFAQEYEASFVNFEGRCYYPFLEGTHCAPLKYDPKRPIALCFDFNVDPGVCAIVQEQVLPGQYERDAAGLPLLNRPVTGSGVIGEVYIEQNSNTPAVCKKILTEWGSHQGTVKLYGDASGGARGTAKVEGSDWDIIKRLLSQGMPQHNLKGFGADKLFYLVPPSNPPERSRVNAVNTRLMSGNGTIRMMVDPAKAPHVVTDLEGVRTLKGGSGEIDKKADPRLTHISDGLGYYIEKEFPVVHRGATVTGLRA